MHEQMSRCKAAFPVIQVPPLTLVHSNLYLSPLYCTEGLYIWSPFNCALLKPMSMEALFFTTVIHYLNGRNLMYPWNGASLSCVSNSHNCHH